MEEDWFYTPRTLENIVYNRTSVSIKEKDHNDFHIFAQLFTLYNLRNGRYLADVDFRDLSPIAREQMVIEAFKLWTSYKTEAGLV